MRLSIEGGMGALMGESGLLQFVGPVVVPFFKMLHTLVKHTQFLHHAAEKIWSVGQRKDS